jgi:class 3 adenylate cyclase
MRTDVSEHTFVFVDLVGFTAIADLEGDARALELALTLQDRTRKLLVGTSGELVKAIGDGVMLRFSESREALEVAFQLIGELIKDEPEFPALRVGIHTGPAIPSGGDWYGRAVNVAARLCAIAPAYGVIVSDRFRETVGSMDDVEWGTRRQPVLHNVSSAVGTYAARVRVGLCPVVELRLNEARSAATRHRVPSRAAAA